MNAEIAYSGSVSGFIMCGRQSDQKKMASEILSPAEMSEADRFSIADGPYSGYQLMCHAGHAVAAEILERFSDAAEAHVLCGPGNNGGDGYVVARLLQQSGMRIAVYADISPAAGTDAALARADLNLGVEPLDKFVPSMDSLVVDALFGAGLSKDIGGAAADAIGRSQRAGNRVVAIDLPSGISGDSGSVCGIAFEAILTVTFFRKKPGHLLYPGRAHCGDLVVADIGIPARVLDHIRPPTRENTPQDWVCFLKQPDTVTHKYRRGHIGVFSGGPTSTGAARLAAIAGLRVGAGAATVLSPPSALQVNAMHLTSVMLHRIESVDDFRNTYMKQCSAYVIGPGFGIGDSLRALVSCLLEPGVGLEKSKFGTVLDADAITAFETDPESLFIRTRRSSENLVLTPHSGEFTRLFPDLAGDRKLSKVAKTRAAAERSGAVVIFKGPDTVIATPDGRAAINTNGTSWLATAGSGDTLAGLCGGLLAQGLPAYEAACCAVWIHAECARRFGPGLIAEDLADVVPVVLADLLEEDWNGPIA